MRELTLRWLWMLILCVLLSACKKEPKPLQGYIDADYTYISSNFSGNLVSLDVRRGKEIQKGDLLFTLEVQPQEAQLKKAQASMARAEAQTKLKQSQLDYQSALFQRYKKLILTGGVSKEEFDKVQNDYLNAKAALVSQKASLEASMAELSQAEWQQSNKRIYSLISGYVYETYFTVGELVPATRPIVSLVSSDNLKVVFYIPEDLLRTLRLNQTVNISSDGAKETIPATISYISSKTEYTPPYIFSESTRTKFIYRIEAKPVKTAFRSLHPGQPVSVSLS